MTLQMLTSFFFLLVYPDKSINPPVKEEPEYRKPLDLKITICRFTEGYMSRLFLDWTHSFDTVQSGDLSANKNQTIVFSCL